MNQQATPKNNVDQKAEPHNQQPAPRMRIPDRTQKIEITINELIPQDHLARQVWQFVCQQIDTTPLEDQIKAVENSPGRNATLPALLTALWIYATMDGVKHGTVLAKHCQFNAPYQWLCGGVSVNYGMLDRFRVAHGQWLDQQIEIVVQTLLDEELASLDEPVGQDGMKTRAWAGASSFRSAERLEELADQPSREEAADASLSPAQVAARERGARERGERIAEAREEVEKVRETKEKKKKGEGKKARASTTDPQARKMKMGDGGYRPAYNVQFATLLSSLVIVGMFVTNSGKDSGTVAPMAEQIQSQYEMIPPEWHADGGYSTRENIEAAAGLETTFYSPVKAAAKKEALGQDPYAREKRDSEAMATWRSRMGTEEAQEKYKARCKCELPNAYCRNRNLQQFVVCGLPKVSTMTKWYVLAHNLQRLFSLRSAKASASTTA